MQRNLKLAPGASLSLSRCWPEVRPSIPRLHDQLNRRVTLTQNVPNARSMVTISRRIALGTASCKPSQSRGEGPRRRPESPRLGYVRLRCL